MIRTGLAIVALVTVALTASSVAFAAATLTGKYATTIKSPSPLKGSWVLSLTKAGTYTVALNGEVLAGGKYSATGSTITFGRETAGGCPKSGKYTWKKSGKTLTFTRISESATCSARSAVLSRTFTQRQ